MEEREFTVEIERTAFFYDVWIPSISKITNGLTRKSALRRATRVIRRELRHRASKEIIQVKL